MTERFDVIVIGAGPAGNAAAYTLAKAGFSVLQLERGESPGTKNVQGAILYANALEQIIPDFREHAPLERHIIEQRMWLVDEKSSHLSAHFRDEGFSLNRYTIIRAKFDRWFSDQVRKAGALVICETTVKDLLKDNNGKVIGVQTERENGEIFADVVILADGVNSLVGQQANLRKDIHPEHVALAVKEVLFLPKETIEQRFNLSNNNQGVVIEIAGQITRGMLGTGFLYTNKDSLSIGIGCLLSDMRKQKMPPYQLLEELKQHPSIKPLIAGAEMKEYAAHLIPEGGYKSLPQLFGEGWLMVGDSAGFVNAVHREGSNLAMTSGRFAAETLIELKEKGLPYTLKNLSRYKQKLDESFVMKDLKKYQNVPEVLLKHPQFLSTYPAFLNDAMREMLTVDGVDKRTKQNKIFQQLRSKRSIMGLLSDAYQFFKAFK
jgi:electron transfer flavoprotein-quinone oxidoreductase